MIADWHGAVGRRQPRQVLLVLHAERNTGERPDITAQFLEFLEREAQQAQALYILGDLFEAWIGDDDPDPDKRRVIEALRSLTGSGVPTYFIHGNRDFLIGRRFAKETGVTLLPDPTLIQMYGQRVLLMHGDTLCIDDPDYQRLRRIVRNPLVQFIMRRMTLRQVFAFLHAVGSDGPGGPPLRVRSVRLSAPRGEEATDLWAVEATLVYLVYDPKAPETTAGGAVPDDSNLLAAR